MTVYSTSLASTRFVRYNRVSNKHVASIWFVLNICVSNNSVLNEFGLTRFVRNNRVSNKRVASIWFVQNNRVSIIVYSTSVRNDRVASTRFVCNNRVSNYRVFKNRS